MSATYPNDDITTDQAILANIGRPDSRGPYKAWAAGQSKTFQTVNQAMYWVNRQHRIGTPACQIDDSDGTCIYRP